MFKIYHSVEELVGNTPLLELAALEKRLGLQATILAKLEFYNPGGSIKDRIAAAMIKAAEKEGKLGPGGVIIEPTSGNTGIGLATMAIARGYRLILVMPENMSKERQTIMKALGAELVLTPASQGMKGAIAEADRLKAQIPGSIIAGQFVNPANPRAHFEHTGPEIYRDTEGEVDIFVAAVGSGGTISGAGKYLKLMNPRIKVVAVEPAGSPVLAGGKPGPHKIQGIGAGFVPETMDMGIVNEVLAITDEQAMACARLICAIEGLMVGISSGANVQAAIELARRPENEGKKIVTVLPDTGLRYLSTELFQPGK